MCLERGNAHNTIDSGQHLWRRRLHKQYGKIAVFLTEQDIWQCCLFCLQPPAAHGHTGDTSCHPKRRYVLSQSLLIEKHTRKAGIDDESNRMALDLNLQDQAIGERFIANSGRLFREGMKDDFSCVEVDAEVT